MEWGLEATGQVEKKVSPVPGLCPPVTLPSSPHSLLSVLVALGGLRALEVLPVMPHRLRTLSLGGRGVAEAASC